MVTLTVELSEQSQEFIDARVRSGEFHDPDEVIAAALVAMSERIQAFNREAQIGIDAFEKGEFVVVDDVKAFLAQRRLARSPA